MTTVKSPTKRSRAELDGHRGAIAYPLLIIWRNQESSVGADQDPRQDLRSYCPCHGNDVWSKESEPCVSYLSMMSQFFTKAQNFQEYIPGGAPRTAAESSLAAPCTPLLNSETAASSVPASLERPCMASTCFSTDTDWSMAVLCSFDT
jgi:hypothetical protein